MGITSILWGRHQVTEKRVTAIVIGDSMATERKISWLSLLCLSNYTSILFASSCYKLCEAERHTCLQTSHPPARPSACTSLHRSHTVEFTLNLHKVPRKMHMMVFCRDVVNFLATYTELSGIDYEFTLLLAGRKDSPGKSTLIKVEGRVGECPSWTA